MQATQHHLKHPKYRRDVDGLRAIAVLSVIGYHYFPGRVPGGFVGVDVFFVISGFLISTIIFGNLDNSRFSYIEFYARRIKRIFPALLLVLSFSMAFGWYVLFPDEYIQLGKHVAGGAGFASNFVLWSEAGYFDRAAETKPLLHLWSLGIEEQFYILWPLLLGIVWRRNLNFLFTTFLVAMLSFVINIYWIGRDPAALFVSPFSRVWELMIGGVLAYIFLHRRERLYLNNKLSSILAPIGLLLVVTSVIWFNKYIPFPGWWALVPTIGASLIIAGHPAGWVNRYLLSHPLMVWIGLISYPLYLWHWPLLAYARILNGGMPGRTVKICLFVASVLLASGTYILVEKRFKRGYSKAAISILASSMFVLFVAGLIVWNGSLAPRLNSHSIEIVVTAEGDWRYPGGLKPVSRKSENVYTAIGSEATTLFLGDSHVQQYAPRVTRLLEDDPDRNTAVFATYGGCPPIPNVDELTGLHCATGMTEASQYIENAEVVVIGASWNLYFLTAAEESSGFTYYFLGDDGRKIMFEGGEGASAAMQELESFVRTISKDKRVFLLLDNPGGDEYSPTSFLVGSRLSQIRSTLAVGTESTATYDPAQQLLREELKAMAVRSGAEIIDPSLRLCVDQRCKVSTATGRPIYKDTDHLRPFFVEKYADFIDVTLR